MSKRLLVSRVFNNTGDWFYYFVIVVVIYTMSKNPIMMGILSASYTMPGLLVSKKLANLIDHHNDRQSLIIFDLLRIVALIGIMITNNVLFALICVFLEQVLAIGSNLAFQKVTLDVIQDEEKLLKFNRHLKIFSNISRLLVIPSYLILHKFTSNKIILGLDILFTALSLFETARIKFPSCCNDYHLVKDNAIYKVTGIKFGKVVKIILIFSILNLFRSFIDAYGITYIGKTTPNVNIGYAALIFILSIADLGGGVISKRTIKPNNVDENHVLTVSFMAITIFFMIPALVHSIYIFIVSIFLLRLVLSILELYVLYNVQLHVPQKIHQYAAFQTMIIDGGSLVNSVLGGWIIQKIDVFNYMIIIALMVLIGGEVLLKRKT